MGLVMKLIVTVKLHAEEQERGKKLCDDSFAMYMRTDILKSKVKTLLDWHIFTFIMKDTL